MKKHRFLLPAAFALAVATSAANAQQASDRCSPALLASLPPELRAEVEQQQDLQDAERELRNRATGGTADTMKTPAPDVKEQSCFDRFSNFRIIVGVGFPTMDGIVDMLMNQLRNQACRIVDQQLNQVTGGVNGQIGRLTNGAQIPGGSVNVGVGTGTAPGAQVNTGTDRVSLGTQGRNVSGDVAGSVGGRVGQAVGGLFR